jgi:hypothetical protein
MFVPVKQSQPTLMLVITKGSHMSEAPFRCTNQVLPTNIRLGWKGLPEIDTPHYYKNS